MRHRDLCSTFEDHAHTPVRRFLIALMSLVYTRVGPSGSYIFVKSISEEIFENGSTNLARLILAGIILSRTGLQSTRDSKNGLVLMPERTSFRSITTSTSVSTQARFCPVCGGWKPDRLDCVFDAISSQTMAVNLGSD